MSKAFSSVAFPHIAGDGAFVNAPSKSRHRKLEVSTFTPSVNVRLTLNARCAHNLVHFVGRDSVNDVRQVQNDGQQRRKLKIAVRNVVKRPVAFKIQGVTPLLRDGKNFKVRPDVKCPRPVRSSFNRGAPRLLVSRACSRLPARLLLPPGT
jgi:hypothetical protein